MHRGSAYRGLTLRTVQQNKPRLRRALKPIVPADIATDDQLPITLAIAVPVKPVIPRLRLERRPGTKNSKPERAGSKSYRVFSRLERTILDVQNAPRSQ